METSPDTDQDGGERIEVDVHESDASKAVTRTRVLPKPKARAGRNADAVDLESWAERSKKVQKRINSMQRNFDQQRADDQALHQRELAALNDRINGLTRGGDNAPSGSEAEHTKAMDTLQAKLEEAQEQGDSKAAAKISRDMATLEGKFWAAQTAKATGATAAADRANTTGNGAARPANGARQIPKPTQAGIDWAKANADWWEDKSDDVAVAARAAANGMYLKMVEEGEDSQKLEFYEKIRKAISKRFPELEMVSTMSNGLGGEGDEDEEVDGEGQRDGDRRQREPVRRQAMPVVDRGQGTARNKPGGQTLTKADQATMRAVGLDPDKNSHVLSFLKEKNQMDAEA